jgi:hypothetical protein
MSEKLRAFMDWTSGNEYFTALGSNPSTRTILETFELPSIMSFHSMVTAAE